MDKRTQMAVGIVAGGVVAMLLGTLTHAWWSAEPHDGSVGLGLRTIQGCTHGACESMSYGAVFEMMDESHTAFVWAGNFCFFGAFLTAAAALAGVFGLLAKKPLPFPAGRITALLALLMLVGALVFVMSKPVMQMGGLSTAYGAIFFMLGAFALLVGGQQLTKAAQPAPPSDVPQL